MSEGKQEREIAAETDLESNDPRYNSVFDGPIREFLCIHRSGNLLFHRQYYKRDEYLDPDIKSGLINALYMYASEVEKDELDVIRMEQVALILRKNSDFIFVLSVDVIIDPKWCEEALSELQERFFNKFPEVLWQTEIIHVAVFRPFKTEVDEVLCPLAKKLALMTELVSENIVKDVDFLDFLEDGELLGNVVGTRLIKRYRESLIYARQRGNEYLLARIDDLLEIVGASHVNRRDKHFVLDCPSCIFSSTPTNCCFYEGLLEVIMTSLDLDTQPITLIFNVIPIFSLYVVF